MFRRWCFETLEVADGDGDGDIDIAGKPRLNAGRNGKSTDQCPIGQKNFR